LNPSGQVRSRAGHNPRLAQVTGLAHVLPPLQWLRGYDARAFASDFFAGLLTTLVSVPQGIAFALLAGLAPEQGLYASVIPPLAYACFGTSRTLLVGPVSVTAVMLAGALSAPELRGHGTYLSNALVLGCESGLVLLTLALLRLGSLVNFISYPVLQGFTSAAAILIIWRLVPGLLGVPVLNCPLSVEVLDCTKSALLNANKLTMLIGTVSVLVMALWGQGLQTLLHWIGVRGQTAMALSRTGPLAVVVLGALLVWRFHLQSMQAVATVGVVPTLLPALSTEFLFNDTWLLLLPSACYVGLIGYVSSVAMAKITAGLRREKIDPNQEALALGLANVMAAFAGSMAVAGGMSQTMLKVAAGARTQIATVVTSLLVGGCVWLFNPLLALIPKTALAAIVLVAIIPVVKFGAMIETWRYQRSDGIPDLATFLGVLLLGLEQGLALGISVTLLIYLWQTSHPHIAIVGRVPHTEHYRNIARYHVETWPHLLLIRVDENLNFANAGRVEKFITGAVANAEEVEHVVLICASISHIDATGLRTLENLSATLKSAGILLHLTEVKGPVMDGLTNSQLLAALDPGQVFFRTDEAVAALAGTPAAIVEPPPGSIGI
jgi:sulfate permease, SulP family